MANDIGGVWRTIGGRRVFIKDGQSLADAMKASGKFNNKKNNSRTRYYNDIQNAKTEDDLQRILAEHDSLRTNTREESKRFMKEWSERAKEIRSNVDKKKYTIDKNDINALNELADSGKDINDYYGLDDIAKDYIKNRRQEIGRNEFTKKADEIHKKTLDEKTRNLEDGKEIHDVFRQMDAKEMEAFAKQNPESIKKMQDYLKSKKTNNDDYEYNLYKQAKENPDSINPMTEWSTDWEDLDKRFKDRYAKENSKYKYSVDGQKITEAEFKAEYEKQKKLGNIDKDMTYDDYKLGIVDDRNSNVRSLKNDLMTAEQLKGKDREEQKEINKQYLKEQNKLAKEKGLINDYNKTDSRGSMSDDSFIEQARKNGMSDEQIAKEVYKKHNGPESNNTSDNNIKRLLAKQAKEEALAKGNKERAKTFENYEKKFESRINDKQSSDNQFTMYNSQYDKEVTVKKGADGKWVDSDGNKYMGYLSKQDVKQYFKGNWKESTEKRTASEILSSQMSKTKNAKIEVANALGLKYDNDNEWKSTSQLYKEQKGKDIANIAIDSGNADKYNAFVKKNYNRDDKNFSDRADIDKYAKDNNLDADALYYMTKIASESDRTKLKKKAFELYKKQHPNTKKTIYSFEDDIK